MNIWVDFNNVLHGGSQVRGSLRNCSVVPTVGQSGIAIDANEPAMRYRVKVDRIDGQRVYLSVDWEDAA